MKTQKTTKLKLTPDDIRGILLEHFGLPKSSSVNFKVSEEYGNNDSLLGWGPTGYFELEEVIIKTNHGNENNKDNDD